MVGSQNTANFTKDFSSKNGTLVFHVNKEVFLVTKSTDPQELIKTELRLAWEKPHHLCTKINIEKY